MRCSRWDILSASARRARSPRRTRRSAPASRPSDCDSSDCADRCSSKRSISRERLDASSAGDKERWHNCAAPPRSWARVRARARADFPHRHAAQAARATSASMRIAATSVGILLQVRAQQTLGDGNLIVAQRARRLHQTRIVRRCADVVGIGAVGAFAVARQASTDRRARDRPRSTDAAHPADPARL